MKFRNLILLITLGITLTSCNQSTSSSDAILDYIILSDMTTTYLKDSEFSFDGVVTAYYSNKSHKVVTPTTVSSVDTSRLGKQNVVVSYTEREITRSDVYSITVSNHSVQDVTSISVSGQQNEFYQDDTFVFGGVVKLHYSNGDIETTNEYTLSSVDMSRLGEQIVRVTYSRNSSIYTEYQINISEYTDDPIDGAYITLNYRTLELERLSNTQYALTVNFVNCASEDVSWSSSDTSVATVSRGGAVRSAKTNNGVAIITCTTESGRKATCVVTVVEQIVPKTQVYQLVTDFESLKVGDIVVIASPENGVTATSECTGMYLHPVESNFSSDYSSITSLGEGTAEFILDGEYENWTLENQEGKYLASTHEKKVTFVNNKGNIHWDIHDNLDDSGDVVIESEVESHGYFMYNIKQAKFTVYTSEIQEGLLVLPKLYKLTYVS